MNEEEKQAIDWLKEIKARLEEIDSIYKMMSIKDDIEGHNVVYVDTPEFEEKYISKDKIRELKEREKNLLEISKSSFYSSDRKLYKEHVEAIDTILNLIEKQQKEIERLKDEYKREVFEHQEFVEDTKVAVQDYIKKYKIKDLIKEKAKTDTYNFKTIAVKDIEELLGE